VIAAAAASGAMAAMTMPAFAEATVAGTTADLAGVVTGHDANLPVNLCRTVNVAGVLNPAVGCAHAGVAKAGSAAGVAGSATGVGAKSVGTDVHGSAADVPGLVTGHSVEAPLHLPVNVVGNGANVVGRANAAGDDANVPGGPVIPDLPVQTPPTRQTPPDAEPQRPEPRTVTPAKGHQAPAPRTVAHHAPAAPQAASSLAHTGSDAAWPALAGSMAMVFGGVILYRRFRPGTQR
jgi:LPXTG-motif cell wall-anchored protein